MLENYGLLTDVDVLLFRLNAGVRQGGFGPVNCSKLDITQPDPDYVDRPSFRRGEKGQLLDSYPVPKALEIEIVFDDMQPDLLSMGLRGVPATYLQAAKTDEAVTVHVYHDRWVALGSNSLTAFAIAGKTAGEDYEVDLAAGLLRVLSTGSIADDTAVDATLSCQARVGSEIYMGTVPLIQLGILTVGGNLYYDGQAVELEVGQASVTPSGALAWVTNEPVSITLKGKLVTPHGWQGPVRYRAHTAA
ncbi:hypothetical protein [Plasticicumulans acidivorans]|uniref:Uncharacterized protein n=1 Tax=Plasticicumulans acidivorans TaxID=886464 RepID=A0A317N5H2_9GAMM|nr:hypothetical protein [Plasticicumulans acidivorans]PWV65999.1 hypothetical protein C7443_101487 [Plasticicumulans acidivorans]